MPKIAKKMDVWSLVSLYNAYTITAKKELQHEMSHPFLEQQKQTQKAGTHGSHSNRAN